jgi:hypothetical protein
LAAPTKPQLTVTPMAIQGAQLLSVNRFAEFYSGNLTVAIIYASYYWSSETSFYISSPGYPILYLENKHVGFKTVYAANDCYEVQIMGVNKDNSVNVSVLKRDDLPKAENPVIIVSEERQVIGSNTTGLFFEGTLVIAVTYASDYDHKVSAEISAPGYDVLSFDEQPIGYKLQYQTDKKYEIQIIDVTSNNGASVAVKILQ